MKAGWIFIIPCFFLSLTIRSLGQSITSQKVKSLAEALANMPACWFCNNTRSDNGTKTDDSSLNTKLENIAALHKDYNSRHTVFCGVNPPPEILMPSRKKRLQIDSIEGINGQVISYCSGGKRYQFFSGKVLGENGNAIAYASIRALNTKNGVVADSSGNFSIGIPVTTGERLVFSSIGYKTRIIDIAGLKLNQDIILTPIDSIYSSVVVVSYGSIRRIACTICKEYIFKNAHLQAKDSSKAESFLSTNAFEIFPNPAMRGAKLTIKLNTSDCDIILIDNNGKIIQRSSFSVFHKSQVYQLNIPSSLATGFYYVIVTDKRSNKQYTEKLIIQ